MREALAQGAKQINVMLTEKQLDQFIQYYALLIEWNQKMNLTAITEPAEVVQKHFLDSLTCLQTGLFEGEKRVLDVGTGAGFPAIPLKIAVPSLNMVLLDSLQKRLVFLQEVVESLGLEQVECVHARGEDAGKNPAFREQFDVVTARAVAPMNVLSELCLPFVTLGGHWVAMKGSQGEAEAEQGKGAIQKLGGTISQVLTTSIDHHTIISVIKSEKTPKQYPRKAGTPSKKPLS